MPTRILMGAMCVQRFDDSLNSAIHITYRISLRSSSMPEPRDPLLKVLIIKIIRSEYKIKQEFSVPPAGCAGVVQGTLQGSLQGSYRVTYRVGYRVTPDLPPYAVHAEA